MLLSFCCGHQGTCIYAESELHALAEHYTPVRGTGSNGPECFSTSFCTSRESRVCLRSHGQDQECHELEPEIPEERPLQQVSPSRLSLPQASNKQTLSSTAEVLRNSWRISNDVSLCWRASARCTAWLVEGSAGGAGWKMAGEHGAAGSLVSSPQSPIGSDRRSF